MKIIQDDLWLCVDCLMVAVNGDSSGIDDDERVKEVERGVAALGQHLVPDFDTEGEENDDGELEFKTSDGDDGHREFARGPCDACGSPLAGEFHRFAILGEGDDGADLGVENTTE